MKRLGAPLSVQTDKNDTFFPFSKKIDISTSVCHLVEAEYQKSFPPEFQNRLLPQDLSGTEFVNIVWKWLVFIWGLVLVIFGLHFLHIMLMSHSRLTLFPHIKYFCLN